MKYKFKVSFLLIFFSLTVKAQYGEDYAKFRFKTPFQDNTFFQTKGITKIYSKHFTNGDFENPYLITKYQFNKEGNLIKEMNSYTNISWKCCDYFDYKTAVIYDYNYVDSFLVIKSSNIRNFVDSSFGILKQDTLKPISKLININNLSSYTNTDIEYRYDFNKDGKCKKILKKYNAFMVDSTTIEFIYYKSGSLKRIKETQARVIITKYLEDKIVNFNYDREGRLTSIDEIIKGKPKYTLKYIYNKNGLIVKREEYFDDELTIIDEFLYN